MKHDPIRLLKIQDIHEMWMNDEFGKHLPDDVSVTSYLGVGATNYEIELAQGGVAFQMKLSRWDGYIKPDRVQYAAEYMLGGLRREQEKRALEGKE